MDIINQVYWDRINETYMFGTQLRKNENEVINFENSLMASGIKIMKWSSSLNYQGNKEVPRLPILISGRKYRIKLNIKVEPEDTAIFCLRFFDLQAEEISKTVFYSKEKVFTYPARAVSYTFEIINGGCNQIEFERVQIGSADINKDAFNDFYVKKLNKIEKSRIFALVLVLDNKRAREIIQQPRNSTSVNTQIMIGYISWQNLSNLAEYLENWMRDKDLEKIIVFSSDKKIDQEWENGKIKFYNYEIVMSNFTRRGQTSQPWFLPEIIKVDQKKILQNVERYLRK